MDKRIYLCIDLKSFYASCECVERNLDPMVTNLVVADSSRTEKTICLAVTPGLKSVGVPSRPRLFEVIQRVRDINSCRIKKAIGREFIGKSYNMNELQNNSSLEMSYIIAPPRMAHYIDYSTRIYNIYLKYISPEDIHVYSIDEVFMDVTNYLETYKMTAHTLAMTMISDVLKQTGITATCGIGTNMYLAKIAMDIVAKHIPADSDGVRIAELDEYSYREKLWSHKPVTDFWRVGKGYKKRLESLGLYTMGDIAKFSVSTYGEDKLYKLFGVNAELLIDHAWGYEPCRISDVKSYKPENRSICSGQVLHCAYSNRDAELVLREMAELLSLDLVEKRMVTDQLVLTVGYDIINLRTADIEKNYKGEITTDAYGRKIPKAGHGTINLCSYTSSTSLLCEKVTELYKRITDESLFIRRLNISANHIIPENQIPEKEESGQLDFFTDYEKLNEEKAKEEKRLEKERNIQDALISLKHKFGKNAVLKGTNLKDGATTRERNTEIGGHRA